MKHLTDENIQQDNVLGGTAGKICGAAELRGLPFGDQHTIWYCPHCPNENNQAELQ